MTCTDGEPLLAESVESRLLANSWQAFGRACRSKFMAKCFGIKVLKYGNNNLYKGGPVLYLVRHALASGRHAYMLYFC